MRIVTITALDLAFKNLVMEGQLKLMFGFGVTTDAELRFAGLQQV